MDSLRNSQRGRRLAARKFPRYTLQPADFGIIEKLEERAMLSVSLDANGWTQVTPSANSQLIYVSSSTGSDSNSGLSPSAPVATIAKGYSLLRNDQPDWLLFKRGDTFEGTFSYFGDSGLSSQEPMVVTDYGDPTLSRPVIDAGSSTAFRTGKSNHDVYVMNLDFTSSTHNPNSPNFTGAGSYGFYDLGGTSDLLIENCLFQYFVNDITFQGYYAPLSNISIRRNEILDAYATAGHSQGLYADSVTNLTIQDNTFDHDGWNSSVAGASATIYNHDCYLHSSNVNCVVTGNVFADAGSFGLQARAGGIVDNNLFVGDPYGFAFGLVNGATATAGGVSGEAIGNVVIEPRHDSSGWGVGAMFGNLSMSGATTISNNIFAADPGGNGPAMQFTPGVGVTNLSQEAGLNNLTVSNNTVYGWGFGMVINSQYVPGATDYTGLNNVTISNNNFQNNVTGRIISDGSAFNPSYETWSGNTYSSSTPISNWFTLNGVVMSFANWQATVEPTAVNAALAFNDPTRTVESYMASQGLAANLSSFISGIRQQSSTNWNPLYFAGSVNTYIQNGFLIGGVAPTPTPPVSTSATTPVGLSATAGTSSINLTWSDPAADQTGFILERAGDVNFTQNLQNITLGAAATSYSDTTAVPGTQYYYELIATNSVGPSAPTTAVTATIAVSTPTPAPAPSPTPTPTPPTSPTPTPTPPTSPTPTPTPPTSPTPTPTGPTSDSAPRVWQIALNSTFGQRGVTSITLLFSKSVTFNSSMISLVLNASTNPSSVPFTVSNPSNDGQTWVITWSSPLPNNALPSGIYTFTMDGAMVAAANGQTVGKVLTRTFTTGFGGDHPRRRD